MQEVGPDGQVVIPTGRSDQRNAMVLQIWDTETANMIGAFPTVDGALCAVRTAIDSHGPAYIATWALEWEDEQ